MPAGVQYSVLRVVHALSQCLLSARMCACMPSTRCVAAARAWMPTGCQNTMYSFVTIIVIMKGGCIPAHTVIIIIIEGLSLLQSIPPTTADKQTRAQKRRGSRSRKLLGAKAKSYRLKN